MLIYLWGMRGNKLRMAAEPAMEKEGEREREKEQKQKRERERDKYNEVH